jgi:hypothetical protein
MKVEENVSLSLGVLSWVIKWFLRYNTKAEETKGKNKLR